MKLARELYQVAMEFYDLARIGKAKGMPHSDYDEKMRRAYLIGREAAIKVLQEDEPLLTKIIYLRSIGWVAFECGQYEEARIFAELALSLDPSDYEKASIKELMDEISKKSNHDQTLGDNIAGTITSVDVEKSKIKFRDVNKKTYHTILVPSELFDLVAHFYIGGTVKVKFKTDDQGHSVLQHIRRAA